ncbi:MAG: type II secretion system F family protein [Actinomycetota bacterium]|nr:type II secretion system F family protein [Actinomycetota bacterium]
MDRLAFLGAVTAGLSVTATSWVLLKPYRRLAPRLRPYAAVARTRLARSYDVGGQAGSMSGKSTLVVLFGPIVESVLAWCSSLVGAADDERQALRLRQAGLYPGLDPRDRIREFRVRSLGRAALLAAGLGGLGLVFGGTRSMVLLGGFGFVLGVAQARSRVSTAILRRRERMRSELYTLNQLIAMRTRVGGGVVDAIHHVVDRANGVFVDDLAEVLRLHASGVPMNEALRRAAVLSAEPEAARTYNVLATAQDRGADLGEALLGLSADLRVQRRDDLQRQAASRRLWLVVPIVLILAPVLLLFIGAPVPTLIFGTGG